MRSIFSLFLATAREWSRDPTALLWTLIFPIMLALFLGLVYTDDPVTFTVGVVTENGPVDPAWVKRFDDHPALKVRTGSLDSELDALRQGRRQAVIVVPAGEPGSDAGAALRLISDPGGRNVTLLQGAVRDVLDGLNPAPAYTLQQERVQSHEVSRMGYTLPGILALGLMQIGLFVTTPLLVSLRERGVLRRLAITPLRRSSLLIAQIAFRLSTALLQTAVILLIGALLYGLRIELIRLPGLIAVVLLGAAVFITFGYFLAGLAKTEEAVQSLIGLPNVLFMLLSGIFFPVDTMPRWIRPVVDLIPLTYLADALRQIMIDAVPLYSLRTDIAVLVGWLIVCFVLSVRVFRWESFS